MQETPSISITNPPSSSLHYFATLSKRVHIKSLSGFRHYPAKEGEKRKIPCITSLSSPQTFSPIFVPSDLAFLWRHRVALIKSSCELTATSWQSAHILGVLMDLQDLLHSSLLVSVRPCLKTSQLCSTQYVETERQNHSAPLKGRRGT